MGYLLENANHIVFICVFIGNYDLVSVVLSTSLVVISDDAFYGCSALQTIIIPT